MPRKLKSGVPPIKLHKATGQAYVNLNGRRMYLGAKYGTPESNARHNRLVTEWKANRCQPVLATDDITIVELVARFVEHAAAYYRPAEYANWRATLRPVIVAYGSLPWRRSLDRAS